jgi:hypothetical protein
MLLIANTKGPERDWRFSLELQIPEDMRSRFGGWFCSKLLSRIDAALICCQIRTFVFFSILLYGSQPALSAEYLRCWLSHSQRHRMTLQFIIKVHTTNFDKYYAFGAFSKLHPLLNPKRSYLTSNIQHHGRTTII